MEHKETGEQVEGKSMPQIVLRHGTGCCEVFILKTAQPVSSQRLTVSSIWACFEQEED